MMFFKRWKNVHRHEFLDKMLNAVAVWSKRNDGDEVYFRGVLRECPGCGAKRFRAPGLREVEVTRCS